MSQVRAYPKIFERLVPIILKGLSQELACSTEFEGHVSNMGVSRTMGVGEGECTHTCKCVRTYALTRSNIVVRAINVNRSCVVGTPIAPPMRNAVGYCAARVNSNSEDE